MFWLDLRIWSRWRHLMVSYSKKTGLSVIRWKRIAKDSFSKWLSIYFASFSCVCVCIVLIGRKWHSTTIDNSIIRNHWRWSFSLTAQNRTREASRGISGSCHVLITKFPPEHIRINCAVVYWIVLYQQKMNPVNKLNWLSTWRSDAFLKPTLGSILSGMRSRRPLDSQKVRSRLIFLLSKTIMMSSSVHTDSGVLD